MSSTIVDVNGALVEFDNLLQALRFLAEETKSDFEKSIADARNTTLSREHVMRVIQEYLSDDAFSRRMINYFKRYQVPTIANDLRAEAQTLIDSSLESYVLSKIDERLDLLLASRGIGQ